MASGSPSPPVITNWAASFSCHPTRYSEPSSAAEVVEVLARVRAAGGVVRVAGSCHSPNDSIMTGDTILSLARMSGIHSIAASSGLVECSGGTTLHTLNAALASAGLALPCLGSISDQTVAGAMATGTHGTGVGHGVLSTALVALELVTGSGEVLQLSRGGTGSAATAFQAALCSLGVLGVVTRVTLQAVPAFDLSVQEGPATLARILATSPQALAASAPYYRFWWIPHTDRVWEWRAHPVPPAQPAAASGGLLAGLARTCSAAVAWFWGMAIGYHALQGLLRASQLAPWLLPRINALYAFLFFRRPKAHTARSDLAFNFNCLFKQYVAEWAIPLEALPQALTGLQDIIARLKVRAHFPVEVRFTAGDDALLSPAHGRVTAWVGIIAYRPYGVGDQQHLPYFAEFDSLMVGLQGRPHWAKVLSPGVSSAHLAALYPEPAWRAFAELRAQWDPAGIFLNPWATRTLLP